MNFIFLFLWVIRIRIANLNPDPAPHWIRIHNTALNWHKHRLSALQFMNNFTDSLGLNFPAIFIFENVFRFDFCSETLVQKKMIFLLSQFMVPVTHAVIN